MNNALSLPSSEAMDRLFLDLLANLNQIGAAINRISPGGPTDARGALQLIVDSAKRVIPSASAVLYTYDSAREVFETASRVSAGDRLPEEEPDSPRPEGIGMRAIRQRRRVVSYEEPDLQIHPLLAQYGARAVACFPLVVADQPVGALYVFLYEERAFSELEQLMLDNLVNQAAMAIYQIRRLAEIQRDLSRKEEELRHLRRAGLLISSRLQLKETLDAILRMAMEVTGARYGIFRLMDREGHHLVTKAIAGEHLDRPFVEELELQERTVMTWVALNRRPVLVRDLREPPWDRIYYPLDPGLEMRSELAVPLIGASGRLEGVLNLESPEVGAFDEDHRRLLQSLAAQAVIAIQEVRLLDALQEAAQWVVNQPCARALNRLAELGCELLNANLIQVWTLRGSELQLAVSCSGLSGAADSPEAAAVTASRKSLERQAVERGELVVRHSPARSQRAWVMPLLGGTGGEAAPVESGVLRPASAHALGAFSAYGPAAEAGLLDWDHKVMACLANYAVLALQNASHQEALKDAQEQRAVAETFAAVGDIAANLLHQLNNKIGTIPVRVQGIQDKCEDTVAADRYLAANLSEIERSANEALDAVRENLSQLRPIHLAEVSVAECVREALASVRLPEGVRVEPRGLERLPAVLAGQRSLAWVFANLFHNAAEAMDGAGRITIGGARRSGWVEITVHDDGPGIPLELHERIFELNFSGRRKQRPSKLGFGLWWVKTLMVRLGGAVSVVDPEIPGATFRLRLPMAETKGKEN